MKVLFITGRTITVSKATSDKIKDMVTLNRTGKQSLGKGKPVINMDYILYIE